MNNFEDQLELLAYLLEEDGIELQTIPTISRRENPNEFPLSFAQQRLWFIDQLIPQSSAYNIPAAVSISGSLDAAVLSQSINEIVRRHEVLRSRFLSVDNQPVQAIAPALNVTMEIVDLQAILEADRQALIVEIAKSEAIKPFDLTQCPLLRAKLLRITASEHVLLLTMHHIISDGWSLGVFLREVATLYEAFSTGKSAPLPELSIQYADFAVWQRQLLQGEVLETQLAYWKQQLAGSVPLLELPTDRPRPKQQSSRGAREMLTLTQSLLQALKDISQQQGVSLYVTLLTAFNILLYRYTRQEDIIVGSPIANRNQLQTENLIGFFVNMLVLRNDLAGNPSFLQLLSRVQEVVLGAQNNQDLPFEKLVETLQPQRDASYTPLFQVMFAFQNTPMPAFEFSGLKLSPFPIDNGTAKFDLTLDLSETESGIAGYFEYNTDLFDAGTIKRMAEHFQILLAGIVKNPQQQLSDLPLLTPTEQKQVLIEWNNTQKEYPAVCIHHLFEEQVKLTPDAVAVVFDTERLTYQELNQRANKLANYLQKLGVAPEVGVGICLERSLDLVVGLLGILKAGGAYIPLDPDYPSERLEFMLQDSQAPILLTSASLLASISQYQGKVVCLDSDWVTISNENAINSNSEVSPTNKAYTLYTSGSTGQPKAVVIEHHSTVAFLDWTKTVFSDRDFAGVLASTSICFDLSVFEIFAPLSWGGKAILAKNALHLPSLPAAQEVTLINTVPSAIAELLRANGIPNSVRTINLAGEALPKKLVDNLYQKTNVKQVFNLYGPSEDTTYSTFALVKPEDTVVSIGRPIANTQVYILDSNLKPVPIGVKGELYIGGEGLARGYFNRKELTAQKFISNPFSNDRNSRLYKTGDLVRYLPNGDIEYFGRLDFQVKIRGFRIELGEIESVLTLHPQVETAIITAENSEIYGKQLVAYIVPKEKSIVSVKELRSHLKKFLAGYMIPSEYVMLDTIPLTPNGKVDRRALKKPDVARPDLETAFEPPRTSVEAKLIEIWSQILGEKQIGIHDNFFELGGHSLLATQVVNQLRSFYQVELPLLALFEEPTVAGLAKILENSQKQPENNRPKIQARPRQQNHLSEAIANLNQMK